MFPNGDRIATGIHGDLWFVSTPGVVGVDQLRCRYPRAAGGAITIGQDVVSSSVILIPHGNGITTAIHGDLGIVSSPGVIGLDQLRRPPGTADGAITIGPD